ncbi:hypothetical protein [Sediminispirochaeta smaragdinae]|uniref:Uncharacterized protein n=1 Tax=Sediminispirochaeta smaragdinae (strain DSM 11293 / JCM 15392 / SEBR 4228) TaxID=573413 RepID=E1RB15_SEDSS|nr:hypothetical protein [Sediminispirochaeta smaragdinae]ADK79545.1 hypothetical protein Spirs_0390 [Sediminispirochaeta smaragdinae DSM 11293]
MNDVIGIVENIEQMKSILMSLKKMTKYIINDFEEKNWELLEEKYISDCMPNKRKANYEEQFDLLFSMPTELFHVFKYRSRNKKFFPFINIFLNSINNINQPVVIYGKFIPKDKVKKDKYWEEFQYDASKLILNNAIEKTSGGIILVDDLTEEEKNEFYYIKKIEYRIINLFEVDNEILSKLIKEITT